MKDVSAQEAFLSIDRSIGQFVVGKNISVDRVPHSDWLVFECRKLNWKSNGINFSLDLFPNFDDRERIESWAFVAVAWYDMLGKRYYVKFDLKKERPLREIVEELDDLMTSGYNRLRQLSKSDIPYAVDLTR